MTEWAMIEWPIESQPDPPGWGDCLDCRGPATETMYWVDGQWVCAACRWDD